MTVTKDPLGRRLARRVLDLATGGPLARWFEEGARRTWEHAPTPPTVKRAR